MERIYAKWKSFESLYKVLSEFKFDMKEVITDDLKCKICKGILIRACQTLCGCRFCSSCIQKWVDDGNRFCPGKTEFCEEEILSSDMNIQVDHRTNIEISSLVVKCPSETCKYECQIINMAGHLRLCNKKEETCPFKEFGCHHPKMVDEAMTEHLQLESHHHNKLVVDTISNLKNEVVRLEAVNNGNKLEIEALKDELKNHKEQIQILQEEMKSTKVQYENLLGMSTLKLEKKLNIVSLDLNSQIEKISQNWERNLGSDLTEMINEMTLKRTESVRVDGKFSWHIEGISERKRKGRWIKSEYFTITDNPYKLRLSFWPNGQGHLAGTNISVFLLVYPSENGTELIWPFKGNVVIKVTNRYRQNSSTSKSQHVVLEEPKSKPFYCSDPFHFSKVELLAADLLQNDCLTIECFVNLM